jgi:hypothetical protein
LSSVSGVPAAMRRSLPPPSQYAFGTSAGDQVITMPARQVSPRNTLPVRSQYQHPQSTEANGLGGSAALPMVVQSPRMSSTRRSPQPQVRAYSPGRTGSEVPRSSLRPSRVRQHSPQEQVQSRQQSTARTLSPHERVQVGARSPARARSPAYHDQYFPEQAAAATGIPDVSVISTSTRSGASLAKSNAQLYHFPFRAGVQLTDDVLINKSDQRWTESQYPQ